ncbi:MAG: elongation factor 4, partial [Eubacteriaceae bacterium]|nr:elongation factor 4 [Eubacteriaceae bacterium]
MSDIQSRIRNFSIIAHIDHGKSTLADRLIEYTGLIAQRDMVAQVLDNMELERERGITIKLQTVRLTYKADDGCEYYLNLIDPPGHVDFTYEVSRSLAACEGAVLVVDATQGVEAQTLANVYLALENDLEIIPVLNKIDLISAEPERVLKEIEDVIGLDTEDAPQISAKEGLNIKDVLEAIVKRVPPPKGDADAPLKALIFDSYYDSYRGVIVSIRVMDGQVSVKDKIKMMSNGKCFEVDEIGLFQNGLHPVAKLSAGEVGYLTASIKNIGDTSVGDTITLEKNPAKAALPGYKKVNSMVYCGIYPVDGNNYEDLKDALGKLNLNDASLLYQPDTSAVLGFGFRCGFLGLLHMEIIQQRLEREFNLDIVATVPSVVYHVALTDGTVIDVDNPTNMPPAVKIEYMEEPIAQATMMLPTEYVGSIMELCQSRRGIYVGMNYLEENRVVLEYELPLNEIIYDFFDALKSRTKGYASLDYSIKNYKKSELVKLDILLNGEIV